MKQFFKIFFASMLGFIVGIVLLVFIFIGIISVAVSSVGNKTVTVDGSYAHAFLQDENIDIHVRKLIKDSI